MQVTHAELVTSAVSPNQYPQDEIIEIALAGRSNVGKSSFINKMINRKGLARTSGQPGKTQTLNFYNINHQFRFVDVPGYGYARVAKTQRASWGKMIEKYLSQRENLQLVFLLMDFRHPPTELDIAMKEFVEELDIPYGIILTKSDKIKKSQWTRHLSLFKKDLDLPSVDALFPFSAESGEGSDLIWEIISDMIEA
ncbi:ribosome biogenesis GTP-binding protein YihA/YsxC [Fundicoccus culcitae]|uniref:Probable GTP-binding protein EngB n=1 Tax=Fundicoccus culcitae TaxID=2969821 RepID=A0ABY5P712_9LACT|nr:ribosome biogenesis GTP-binding protein YihA/YsxC [Fundicoccus culcitae]UUX34526.1 ribosome biogenesis GTP-binding protein YihA/YsxC [Fundicoccus culcitae]